ncbi:hypothetical protein LAZ67_16001076 [Cordylochernes scorpioides]|uniref:Reverse transcriptase domain-containing protein n=1 Tax=Cordylochernes scorpioides TaxID=51811 RepID=A0ABY6LD64_9ARAC|nr:hypothetical protein LAZ67_16001076 [Cordylochernes scorpioides]
MEEARKHVPKFNMTPDILKFESISTIGGLNIQYIVNNREHKHKEKLIFEQGFVIASRSLQKMMEEYREMVRKRSSNLDYKLFEPDGFTLSELLRTSWLSPKSYTMDLLASYPTYLIQDPNGTAAGHFTYKPGMKALQIQESEVQKMESINPTKKLRTGLGTYIHITSIEQNPGPPTKKQTTLTASVHSGERESIDGELKMLILNMATEIKSLGERIDIRLTKIETRMDDWDKRFCNIEEKLTKCIESQQATEKLASCNSLKAKTSMRKKTKREDYNITRYRWSADGLAMFKMKLEELREKNIPASDDLVYTFNQRILEAMSSAKITYSIKGGPRKSKPWFDKDCYDMKKLAKESLKKYRKTNRLEDRECYASSRKKYLALLDLKRKGFDNEKQEILRNAKDSKTFWKTIALYKSTSIIQGEISIQDWLNFYRELMTTEKNLRICNLHNVISQNDPILDSEITNADIYKEIAGLRSNKACGPDGIPNEVLKTLPDSYILLLKQLYNSVMTTEKYPAIWTNSTIHPIFKNGYKNSPSNYREFGDIHLLLYADDIAIIGESRMNLQKKIKILKEYIDENLMTLNESKSKIMVFRNGGHLESSCDTMELEVQGSRSPSNKCEVKKDKAWRTCHFCHSNGVPSTELYAQHMLRDGQGGLACPLLRNYRSPRNPESSAVFAYTHSSKTDPSSNFINHLITATGKIPDTLR